MEPSCANLFVGYIENQFFSQYNGPKPKLYRRYIDECVGYPDSVVKTAQQRAQTADQHWAPQTSQKEENQRIPFTLTFHPLNLPVKNIILKNFKLLQNDNETGNMFSLLPLTSFKRNKNVSDFLVRSTLKSDESPSTFNCTRKRCKTCPSIHNTDKVTGPKRSIKITDRFTCTSANVTFA